jgi:hypothetical protein
MNLTAVHQANAMPRKKSIRSSYSQYQEAGGRNTNRENQEIAVGEMVEPKREEKKSLTITRTKLQIKKRAKSKANYCSKTFSAC